MVDRKKKTSWSPFCGNLIQRCRQIWAVSRRIAKVQNDLHPDLGWKVMTSILLSLWDLLSKTALDFHEVMLTLAMVKYMEYRIARMNRIHCECEGISPCQVAILSSQSSTTPWAVGVSSGAFNGDGSVTSAGWMEPELLTQSASIRIHPVSPSLESQNT